MSYQRFLPTCFARSLSAFIIIHRCAHNYLKVDFWHGEKPLNSQFSIPLSDFPQFWEFLAVLCLLLAIYFGYIGYKRIQGKGGLLPNELIFLWFFQVLKGKEKRIQIERKMRADTKMNKMYGTSTIFGAIGSLLLSIFLFISAILMRNFK